MSSEENDDDEENQQPPDGTRKLVYEKVKVGQWVVVKYEGEHWLGNVCSKTRKSSSDISYVVQCLDKPYGITGVPQTYENGQPIAY